MSGSMQPGQMPGSGEMNGSMQPGQMPGSGEMSGNIQPGQMEGGLTQPGNAALSQNAGEIVMSTVENTASSLMEDLENATYIAVADKQYSHHVSIFLQNPLYNGTFTRSHMCTISYPYVSLRHFYAILA